MARANHYCITCGWHFRVDPERHIELEHDDGVAQIIEDGDYEDWKRRKGFEDFK